MTEAAQNETAMDQTEVTATEKPKAKAKAKPKAKAKAKVVVAKDKKNGIARPSPNTKTGLIWAIADSISSTLKAPADRKAVLAEAVKKKINPATAATQYGRWRKYNGLEGRGVEVEAKKTA